MERVDRSELEQPSRIALAIAASLLAAAAAALFLWLNSVDDADRVAGQPMTFGDSGPITSIEAILAEPAKRNLVGREVALRDVVATEVPGDVVFLAGNEHGSVPVVLLGEERGRQAEERVQVERGDSLRIFGIVRTRAMLADASLLSPSERDRLREAPLYIEALRVVEVDPDGTGPDRGAGER